LFVGFVLTFKDLKQDSLNICSVQFLCYDVEAEDYVQV
jgi:hypothetical protein